MAWDRRHTAGRTIESQKPLPLFRAFDSTSATTVMLEPLAEGSAIAAQTEVASERHATPIEGAACRSVPVADELWRRRESNPRPEMLRPGPLRA